MHILGTHENPLPNAKGVNGIVRGVPKLFDIRTVKRLREVAHVLNTPRILLKPLRAPLFGVGVVKGLHRSCSTLQTGSEPLLKEKTLGR